MNRAIAFKKAYAPSWRVSNQKESFVEHYFKAFGFKVRKLGIGVESTRFTRKTGSLPDFAVYNGDELLLYAEVTGANKNYVKGDPVYITFDKFLKYRRLAEKTPLVFIFVGLRCGKIVYVGYCWYEDLYPYAEEEKNIITKNYYGIEEIFVKTPFKLWQPLHKLTKELLQLRGCC